MNSRSLRSLLPYLLLLSLLVVLPRTAQSQIHDAARRGDLATVSSLLQRDPALVRARDATNLTPLHVAAAGDHVDVMRLLLERGAEVDATEVGGHTALHLAASNDAAGATALLLERGASVTARNSYDRTALLLCARQGGQARTCGLLLHARSDPNARDRFNSTPLELAAWRGKGEVIAQLLQAGAAVPTGQEGAQQMYMAAQAGLSDFFNALVRAGNDPSVNPTMLLAAAGGGSVQIVDTLLSRGFSIAMQDAYGWSALHYAARDGRTAMVELLLRRGAPRDARNTMGQSPLNVAEEMEHPEIREVLLAAGADPGPLQFPVLRGDYLGQQPPGDVPQLFASGIVSSIWGLHSTVMFSPDGNTALWTPMIEIPGQPYSIGGVLMMQRENGRWSAPAWAPFAPRPHGDVPFFSPAGDRVYFMSAAPLEGSNGGEHIWYSDRTGTGWGAPRPVDAAVNRYPHHWQFSVDREQTLYFSSQVPGGMGERDIYRSRLVNGHWQEPENLGAPVNTAAGEEMPFIAPDGSYLLFSRNYDLFISYRNPDGTWGEARNLGEPINAEEVDICPIVSPDGKYLFFLSQRGGESHVWWVSAAFIERMRPARD